VVPSESNPSKDPAAVLTWYCDLNSGQGDGSGCAGMCIGSMQDMATGNMWKLTDNLPYGVRGVAAVNPTFFGERKTGSNQSPLGNYVSHGKACGKCMRLTKGKKDRTVLVVDRCAGGCKKMAEQESCAGTNHTNIDLERQVECTHCFPQFPEHGQINPLPSGVVPEARGQFQSVDWCAQNDHAHFDVDRGTIEYLCGKDETCTIDDWEEVECSALEGNWRNGCDDDNWSNCPNPTQLNDWGTDFYSRDWTESDGEHTCKCSTVGFKTKFTTERACIEDWAADPWEACTFGGDHDKSVSLAVSDNGQKVLYDVGSGPSQESVSFKHEGQSGQFDYDVESTVGVAGDTPSPSPSNAPTSVTVTAVNMPAVLDAPKPKYVATHSVGNIVKDIKSSSVDKYGADLPDVPVRLTRSSSLQDIVSHYCKPWHYGCDIAARQKFHELATT